MRYYTVRNYFIQALTQKNANIVLLHRSHHILFHIIQILCEWEPKTVPWLYLASMDHVLYAKLNIETFKWLKVLLKIYKEAVHEVGVGTDAQIKFWK